MAKDRYYNNLMIPAKKETHYFSGSNYAKLLRLAHLHKVSPSRELGLLIEAASEEK